jgi:hypothetical protein
VSSTGGKSRAGAGQQPRGNGFRLGLNVGEQRRCRCKIGPLAPARRERAQECLPFGAGEPAVQMGGRTRQILGITFSADGCAGAEGSIQSFGNICSKLGLQIIQGFTVGAIVGLGKQPFKLLA